MTNKDENRDLLQHFLGKTYYKGWHVKNIENSSNMFRNLEIQLKSKCNLDCTYCYYNSNSANGDLLNPKEISTSENLVRNIDILINFLRDNDFFPQTDFFGGTVLSDPASLEVVYKYMEFYKDAPKKDKYITLPTNMTFLRSEKQTNDVYALFEKAKSHGIRLSLSASFDGKYMDQVNRPVYSKKPQEFFYTGEYYDKVFRFAKQFNIGFHPMVHFTNIDKWIDNFNWFQTMFAKYKIPWNNIYLLEVRNDGWTKQNCIDYMKFYKHVLNYVYERLGRDNKLFVEAFIFNGGGTDITGCNISRMNMFNNVGKINRGMGCSVQTSMQLRLGDLTVTPCHRQSYKGFNGFKYLHDGNSITDIEPLNTSYYLSTMYLEHKSFPYCENCLIKHVCSGGCLGSQYEAMGDPYTPIPSVCLIFHTKVKAQVEFLLDTGMYEYFLNFLDDNVRTSLDYVKNILLTEPNETK